jgi:hypothetical protein
MHTKEQMRKLIWCMNLSRSCGWWEPYKGIVFICERPSIQAVDNEGRLHSSTGPSLKCRDGWEMYSWHGVTVQREIITEPQSITLKQINEESNAEIRRVLIERFGFERYLKEGGFKKIQQDDFGILYKKEVAGEPAMVFVKVVNSTREKDGTYKEYVIPVLSTVRSAHEAVASTFGLRVEEYAPECES